MKLTQSSYLVLIILLSFLTHACSVSSSQFESFTSSEKRSQMENYYWKVTYDGLNYKLIAIEVPNGTLFADKFGNSFFFDGWNISSIVGFGDFEGEYDFTGDEVGQIELNDENSFLLQNSCGEWRETYENNGLIFEQACGKNKQKFFNKIYVNGSGEIVHIQQYLEPFNKLLNIKKSNLNR